MHAKTKWIKTESVLCDALKQTLRAEHTTGRICNINMDKERRHMQLNTRAQTFTHSAPLRWTQLGESRLPGGVAQSQSRAHTEMLARRLVEPQMQNSAAENFRGDKLAEMCWGSESLYRFYGSWSQKYVGQRGRNI